MKYLKTFEDFVPVEYVAPTKEHPSYKNAAKKKRKKSDRNITDLSFCKRPHINGEWAKMAAAEMYGEVKPPVLKVLENPSPLTRSFS